MFIETLTTHDGSVGIACEGTLTEVNLKRLRALLHERLATANRPGLVVELTGFDGYDGLAALREDLKMDAAHLRGLTRKRRCGQGWLILAGGNQSAAIRPIRTHDTVAF